MAEQTTRITHENGQDLSLPDSTHGYRSVNETTYQPKGGQASTYKSTTTKDIQQSLVKHVPINNQILDLLHSTGLGDDLTLGGDDSGGGGGGGGGGDGAGSGSDGGAGSSVRVFQNAGGDLTALAIQDGPASGGLSEYVSGKLQVTEQTDTTESLDVTNTTQVKLRTNTPTRSLDLQSTTLTPTRVADAGQNSTITVTYGQGGGIESVHVNSNFNQWQVTTHGSYDLFTADSGNLDLEFNSENTGDLLYQWGSTVDKNYEGAHPVVSEEWGKATTTGIDGRRVRIGDYLAGADDPDQPIGPQQTADYQEIIESIDAGTVERNFEISGAFLRNDASIPQGSNGGGPSTGGSAGEALFTLQRTILSERATNGQGLSDGTGDANSSQNSTPQPIPLAVVNSSDFRSFGYVADEARDFVTYLSVSEGADHAATARKWAILQIAGGAAEAFAGPAGALHGADTAWAGLKQLWYGDTVNTFTSKAVSTSLQYAGVSAATADGYGQVADLVIGFGAGAAGVNKAAGRVARAFSDLVPVGDKIADGARSLSKVIRNLRNGDDAATTATKLADNLDDIKATRASKGNFGGCFVPGTPVLLCAERVPASANAVAAESVGNGSDMTVKTTIESVQLGSRVPDQNPRPEDYDFSLPSVQQDKWLQVDLQVFRSDGAVVEMQLLRPAQWVEDLHLDVGVEFKLKISDIEVDGNAVVSAIKPCCPITDGPGSVVTGRYLTRQVSNLVAITLENGTRFTGTTTHPVWVPAKGDWVELGDLNEGEKLESLHGAMAVTSLIRQARISDVFNIEVHGHHVYRITCDGVLVHNMCAAETGQRGHSNNSNTAIILTPGFWESEFFVLRDVYRAERHALMTKEHAKTEKAGQRAAANAGQRNGSKEKRPENTYADSNWRVRAGVLWR